MPSPSVSGTTTSTNHVEQEAREFVPYVAALDPKISNKVELVLIKFSVMRDARDEWTSTAAARTTAARRQR